MMLPEIIKNHGWTEESHKSLSEALAEFAAEGYPLTVAPPGWHWVVLWWGDIFKPQSYTPALPDDHYGLHLDFKFPETGFHSFFTAHAFHLNDRLLLERMGATFEEGELEWIIANPAAFLIYEKIGGWEGMLPLGLDKSQQNPVNYVDMDELRRWDEERDITLKRSIRTPMPTIDLDALRRERQYKN